VRRSSPTSRVTADPPPPPPHPANQPSRVTADPPRRTPHQPNPPNRVTADRHPPPPHQVTADQHPLRRHPVDLTRATDTGDREYNRLLVRRANPVGRARIGVDRTVTWSCRSAPADVLYRTEHKTVPMRNRFGPEDDRRRPARRSLLLGGRWTHIQQQRLFQGSDPRFSAAGCANHAHTAAEKPGRESTPSQPSGVDEPYPLTLVVQISSLDPLPR
jgi:hypothetical protein